ncbi:hypothetical protein [Microbacterium sp.]|uniref:hypothetical protein n=1 Tax=Microbacterium sp. TaxID=51671 RepID=UPI003A94FF81
MGSSALSKLVIVRRSDRPLELIDDRQLYAAIASGEWTRVTTGAYTPTRLWAPLKPIEQHKVFVGEVARRLKEPAVISHLAATAEHGIDVLGSWPRRMDVTTRRTVGGRSNGTVQRHTLGLDDVQTKAFGRHRITTPAQTALDLARSLPFVRAVSAVDQAIWTERAGGPLTTLAEIIALMNGTSPHRGDARARRVLAFAEPLAANVRESQSRVVVVQLGFPKPQLQKKKKVLRSGRVAYGDLYFADEDHWCEIDGRVKYVKPEYDATRDITQIVIDEKDRENEIRREVTGFSRWAAKDGDNPRVIWDILTGDGMPCSKPRP